MSINIYDIWAKTDPYQSLLQHSINSGAVCRALLEKSSLKHLVGYMQSITDFTSAEIIELCTHIVALHDIGKCHPFFQEKYEPMEKLLNVEKLTYPCTYHFRHEKESERVLKLYWKGLGMSKSFAQNASQAIGKHHDKETGKEGESKVLHASVSNTWSSLQKEILDLITKAFPFPNPRDGIRHIDGFFMTIWGVMILSDWVASGEYFFESPAISESSDIGKYLDWAISQAAHTLCELGLQDVPGLPDDLKYKEIFGGVVDYKLRPIQEKIMEIFEGRTPEDLPGLVIVEAPMGEGKTEVATFAASRLGQGNKGLYFALPTAATSTQMHKRVGKLLETLEYTDPLLLHSTAWIEEYKQRITKDDAYGVDKFLTGGRKGLLNKFAVGTIDQLLFSVLPVKFSVLRLIGVATKVVVIDEVHAYDAYMSSILVSVLKWCSAFKVPVILLSATLPKRKRQEFLEAYAGTPCKLLSTAYPLITMHGKTTGVEEISISNAYMDKQVGVELVKFSTDKEELYKLADRVKKDGGCAAFILNTVAEAQDLYKGIRERINNSDEVELILFHARFTQSRRTEIEKQVVELFGKDLSKRPKKAIVVATQVLEQSLDVDFDWIISELSPIDLLLQRMGRQQRFNTIVRGEAYKNSVFTVIVNEATLTFDKHLIYFSILLERTYLLLKNLTNVRLPGDIRTLIESVYSEEGLEEDKVEKWFAYKIQESINSTYGSNMALRDPSADEFGVATQGYITTDENKSCNAKTRIGEPSRTIVFIEESEFLNLDFSKPFSKKLAVKLLQQSVSLAEYNLILQPAAGYLCPTEGTGYLQNVWVYPMKNGIYKVEDKKIDGYELTDIYGLKILK